MTDLRRSAWQYNTGAGGSVSVGPLSASRGLIALDDPSGKPKRFDIATFGIGWNVMRLPAKLRLPDIPLPRAVFKGNSLAGSGSSSDFIATGWVYINHTFTGNELKESDFEGGACSIEMGGGVLVAGSITAMYVGIPVQLMMAAIANPMFSRLALNAAKAVVILLGVSEGLMDGIGATASVGALTYRGDYA